MDRIIIPAVGKGRRFKEAGYTESKPFIRIGPKNMLEWAIDPIPRRTGADQDWMIWLVCQYGFFHQFQAALNKAGRSMSSEVHVLPGITEGAACSVLSVVLGFPQDEPVAVMNCDQWFSLGRMAIMHDGRPMVDGSLEETIEYSQVHDLPGLHRCAMEAGWDGFILTFPGEGTKWSYVREGPDGFIAAVAEKEPISNQATVGYYWFRRTADLVRGIAWMIATDRRVKGEFYLCPVYNELIRRMKRKIKAIQVEQFWGLGTPEDVELFKQLELGKVGASDIVGVHTERGRL